jgi:hypothetical protein
MFNIQSMIKSNISNVSGNELSISQELECHYTTIVLHLWIQWGVVIRHASLQMMDTQSRKLGIRFHRTFGPVNCEELQDRTRFYRTDNKIMIFFLNNKFILFKCHILITLNLQSQTAISTIREQRKG